MGTNEIAFFTESVNTLIQGKLILVDKHIAQVLKCVAESPTLCRALADTVQTMSYATEFSRARVTWTRSDGVVESRLKLPSDRNRLFAFVVCLLTEVDSGRRNILDFCKEYYYAGNNDRCFAKFADEVLKPFKQAGEAILSNIDPDSFNWEFTAQAEQFFSAEKIYIQTDVLNQILAEAEQIRQIVVSLNLSKAEKDEYDLVSEYLVNALYLKNPKILTISFLAYKYVTRKYSEAIEYLNRIAQLLRGVLK